MKGYNRGKQFEQQKAEEERKRKERELEARQLRLELREKLLEQDQKINAQGELFQTQQFEMKQEIHELRLDHQSLKMYVETEFTKVYAKMEQELAKVHTRIDELRVAVKEEMQEMKHQFGQEILRIDRQQMEIVNGLERYAQRVEQYRKESEYIKREAMQMKRDSEFVLRRAEYQYQKVQWEEKKLKDTLESYQGKMFVEFQKQKMLLDDISMQQHYKLKDIAYERMGTEILKREMVQRVEAEKSAIASTRKDVERLHEKVQMQRSLLKYDLTNNRKIQGLEDQLFFAQEKLMHQQNRMQLMKGEQQVYRMMDNVRYREQSMLRKGK